MKADEVLRRYAAGERDFRRISLRGQSFKGKNLSGADFSEADIRGADFTNAYLKDAKFCGAKAGLQRRWATSLVIGLWILSGLSGIYALFFGTVAAYMFDRGIVLIITACVAFITFAVSWLVDIRKGLVLGFGTFAGVFAVVGALVRAVAIAFIGIFILIGGGGFIFAVIGAFTGFFTGSLTLSLTVAVVVTVTMVSCYIRWLTLAEDKEFDWIWSFAITFAATGGTSFRHADLTNADFCCATLKSTDFRGANLTRTFWQKAEKLDRVRPGKTYLKDAQVRQLLITGQGQDQNFDYRNLRGVNLQGANLADSSFIGADLNEANLQDADLSRAKLVQTQLDEADLTGATLTGATIEDWNITSHTKLQGIRCRYVFMRLPTKDDPNQRRKPDNWDEEFEDGDFADFIKPIVDTLDLYHNQGVDPRAIAISFKQLAENNPEAELRIAAMEARGQDKFLLRAATAPDADHSKLNAEYFKTYNQIKALAEAEVQALLAEKDSRISSLETMVETALQRPSFYTNTQVEQVGIMTNNPGGISQSNTGSMGGGQQGAIGDHNKQTMSTQAAASAGEQLTQQEVLQMLEQIEQMIDSAEIPEDIKEEANTYLGAAKKAVEKEEPNKERVNINLEGVAEELEKASKVAEAGTTLFTKVKPIFVKVAGWLGAAAGSFLGTL
ncbi:MAG: pentapeptide repeat-containing protein [Coleofasciculus sp.]|uniref:pentapeptide repeat-containing protein n=1 Tax=Coleofasciculus sp. TaxID=3100458 RepID=UPI003A3FE4CF